MKVKPKTGEDRLSWVQRIGHIGDWEWDLATDTVYLSDELCRLFGYEPGTLSDFPTLIKRVHPESSKAFVAAIGSVRGKGGSFDIDIWFTRTDGSHACFHVYGEQKRSGNGNAARMAGIVQDITGRKRSEEALQESEKKYRAIFDKANDGILIADVSTRKFVEANRNMCRMLGYDREELLTVGIEDIHPKAEVARIVAEFESQMRGDQIIARDLPVLRKDGSIFYADIGAATITLGGRPHSVGIFRDTTERKLAEEQLRESEARLRESQEVAKIGSWSHDVATDKVEWSDEVFRLFDKDPDRFSPSLEYFAQRMHPDDTERVQRSIQEAISNDLPYHVQPRIINESGRKWTMEAFGKLEKDEDGRPVRLAGTAQDITERRRFEREQEALREQLAQSQRLESVGRLAGGIAHDFNNALQVILGNIDLAMEKIPEGDGLSGHLDSIKRAAVHSAELTQQLLAFARRQTIEPRLLDLNEAVAEFIDLPTRLIGENVNLTWEPGAQPATVVIDPTQVFQVLANLCTNAGEAIESVGNIGISTRNISLGKADCAAHVDFRPGDYVVLEVRDDGHGMDREVLEHIFEPFFTTRSVNMGTGLGLSTVHGIVMQSGGFIEVQSEPGKGTSFRIYLPLVEGVDMVPAVMPDTAHAGGQGHGETVLLVEDEVDILKLGKKILEGQGYRVIPAATPEAALEAARLHIDDIEFLVTDVVMPQMNGQELATRLRRLKPDLKCLYMSGYAEDVLTRNGVLAKGLTFIKKPFSIEEIAQKMGEMSRS